MRRNFFQNLRVVFAAVISLVTTTAAAQTPARSGAEIYRAACTTCHGPDGKGQPAAHLGFTDVEPPDFTDCKFSSPEPETDWIAQIHRGGPARAFSKRMPSFGDALSDEEIENVASHLRTFCTDRRWPQGDLNLPRPFVTEKAFPENEAVTTVTIPGRGPRAIETEVVYEHRLGPRSQYEVAVPFVAQQPAAGDNWGKGLGDVAVAIKHALFASMQSGTIASAGVEAKLPTGKSGIGGGVTVGETFVTISQILPRDGFLHFHGGFEFPIKSDEPNEAYWRVAGGKTLSHDRWGRAFSPMLELVAAKELADAAKAEWDAIPQMQVTLSTRQHIAVSVGVSLPINERDQRGKTFLTYFLWDWFDGGLFAGW